ncbi:MAG: hypothetical protein IJG47_13485 [Microbacterium sp.]|nr:hypothetical protein [Microbacterium sp.]
MAYVSGDLEKNVALRAAGPEQIRSAASTLAGSLCVSRASVGRVLGLLREDLAEPASVQAWASLVRWGRFSEDLGARGQAIDLIYESGYEEKLIEVVGRLDEIGDLVDGAVSKAEIDYLRRLIGT